MGKYDELTRGQTEAAVNMLGGMEGLRKLLQGKLKVVHTGHRIWSNLTIVATTPHGFNMYQALEESGIELS